MVCVGFLFHLNSVLCQMYSDGNLCPTPVNTTNETLTEAIKAESKFI